MRVRNRDRMAPRGRYRMAPRGSAVAHELRPHPTLHFSTVGLNPIAVKCVKGVLPLHPEALTMMAMMMKEAPQRPLNPRGLARFRT
jgi:hypothetical protein